VARLSSCFFPSCKASKIDTTQRIKIKDNKIRKGARFTDFNAFRVTVRMSSNLTVPLMKGDSLIIFKLA